MIKFLIERLRDFFRVSLKALLCGLIIIVHVVLGVVFMIFLHPDWIRRARSTSCHFLAKAAALVLGIHVRAPHAHLPKNSGHPRLLIANHVGYVDIVLFLSQMPCVFITSQELGANPILGPVARMGGSYLVDRKNKFGLKNEIRDISRLLLRGFPVFLFPEATSHDGSALLPFKRALLEAGIRSEAEVYPFCINYLKVDGQEISFKNRDQVFYYGDAEFVSHLIGLLKTKRIEVEIVSLAALRIKPETDSRSLCAELEQRVRAVHKSVRA